MRLIWSWREYVITMLTIPNLKNTLLSKFMDCCVNKSIFFVI